MLTQSDAAIAAWRATERTLDAKVSITDSNGNITDYGTTDVTSIAYDSGAFSGDTFSIGSTYENNMTVTFAHLVEGLQQGYKVTAKIGIKLTDGTYEYCPLGVFVISDDISMDRNNDITTIKCYDQFCAMEGTYTSALTYPAKVVDVIAEIANKAGVVLNTGDIAKLPTQADIASAITGQTYRVAIGWIAQFYGGFALFDRDGKLTIRTTASPDYILDPSQYEQSGLTKNEATYKIGGMSVSVTTTTTDSTGESSETTSTLTAGSTSGSQIELTNNIMTQDRLGIIWSTIKDITFYPYSVTWFGNPAIEAGDWLTLKDTAGNAFNVPNSSYTMTFDGGLTATSKADQTSTSSSSYSYSGTLSQTVKQLAGRQGATGNYIYGEDVTEDPTDAKIGDQWYKKNGNKTELWLYKKQSDGTGKWTLIVSDLTSVEITAKVNTAMTDVDTAKQNTNTAVETANTAINNASVAITNAQNAADTANNASEIANTAISQATSASNVANAVNQSVTALKDGSTMTIAELENGLALKMSASQVDDAITAKGYATQTWTTTQINTTASGINATISSVQTQVNNSAVGTNLISGSTLEKNWYAQSPTTASLDAINFVTFTKSTTSSARQGYVHTTQSGFLPSQYYTLSAEIYIVSVSGSGTDNDIHFRSYDSNLKATGSWLATLDTSKVSVWQKLVVTGKTPADVSGGLDFGLSISGGITGVFKIRNFKLEKGTTATDYSTNPADNATVTSVASLSVTVNSISTQVQSKVDNTTFTSYQTQVSNAFTNKVDSSAFTSYRTQTDQAIQQRVTSDTYNSDQTILSNLINSKVTANGDITNIVLNPYFDNSSANGWTGLAGVNTGNTFPGTKYYGGQTGRDAFYGGAFTVVPGDTYYFKVTAWTDNSTYNWLMGFRLVKSDGSITWNAPIMFAPSDKTTKTAKLVIPSGIVQATVWTQINATSNFGEWWFTNVYVGKTAPAGEMYSQIQQLSNNINLRVQKNDVINQINVSSEGILIDGAKVHITGTTTIDNAVIKSAMIDSLSASKLTAGIIDASVISVINLNASSITSGTLTGVTFHQSSTNSDTWINDDGISNYNNTNSYVRIRNGNISAYTGTGDGMFMDSGELFLTTYSLWANSGKGGTPQYGQIGINSDLFSSGGVQVSGNGGFTVKTSNSNVDSLSNSPWTSSQPTGAFIGGTSAGNILMASNLPTLITAGSRYSTTSGGYPAMPYVQVGGAVSNAGDTSHNGSSIILSGYDTLINADNGNISLAASKGNVQITGGGFIATAGGSHIRNTQIDNELWVNGNFSVSGTKNAVVETSVGWININAYETAEYYFGDLGKVNTGSGSKVKIVMDSLFLETVNTKVDYHVFVSSYGNGYAWVSEQGSDYFVIESNVPNLEISYEVKAKRLGYEDTRLEVNTQIEEMREEVA